MSPSSARQFSHALSEVRKGNASAPGDVPWGATTADAFDYRFWVHRSLSCDATGGIHLYWHKELPVADPPEQVRIPGTHAFLVDWCARYIVMAREARQKSVELRTKSEPPNDYLDRLVAYLTTLLMTFVTEVREMTASSDSTVPFATPVALNCFAHRTWYRFGHDHLGRLEYAERMAAAGITPYKEELDWCKWVEWQPKNIKDNPKKQPDWDDTIFCPQKSADGNPDLTRNYKTGLTWIFRHHDLLVEATKKIAKHVPRSPESSSSDIAVELLLSQEDWIAQAKQDFKLCSDIVTEIVSKKENSRFEILLQTATTATRRCGRLHEVRAAEFVGWLKELEEAERLQPAILNPLTRINIFVRGRYKEPDTNPESLRWNEYKKYAAALLTVIQTEVQGKGAAATRASQASDREDELLV